MIVSGGIFMMCLQSQYHIQIMKYELSDENLRILPGVFAYNRKKLGDNRKSIESSEFSVYNVKRVHVIRYVSELGNCETNFREWRIEWKSLEKRSPKSSSDPRVRLRKENIMG